VKGTKDEGSLDSEYIVRIDGAKDFGGELLKKGVKLYYHQTSGGAEYLCSSKVKGTKDEGSFDSEYIVRIDGAKDFGGELLTKVLPYAKGGMMADGGYVIFEGQDHYNNKPLYQVISKDEDNDYVGEFHDNREDAEKELNELKNKNMHYDNGGMMADGGRIKEEEDSLLGYEPYFEKYVRIASIDREKKIVRPTHGYYPKHPMSKKAINWAKKHGYDYIADGKKYADGGAIEDQYEGRSPEDIWNHLTERQRIHFLADHRRSIIGNDPKEPYYENSKKNWNDLDGEVSQGFYFHVKGGQYAKGGEIFYEKKLKDGNIFQVVPRNTSGMRGVQDEYTMLIVDSKGKVVKNWGSHPSLSGAKNFGERFDDGEYAKGGRVYKDWTGSNSKETWGKENLYPNYENTLNLVADVSDYYKELAKDVSEKYAQEQKNTMIEVLKTGKITYNDGATLKFAKGGMLTKSNLESIKNKYEENEDENYHGENVILLAENFGSAEDLSEAKRLFNLHKKEGYLSSENGKMRQDLHLKLIRKARAEMKKEGIQFAKGGQVGDSKDDDKRKNKWEYTDKDEIEYVVFKDKNGKELKFDGKDVISGVHDLLEKGGKLTEIGKYYSKNDVISVFVNGKNILDKNTVSGVWIKKDAKPMADEGFVVVSENDGYWYIMSKPTSKQVAEEFLSTLTIPRGEVGKVVSVEEAKNHKKVIGKKYLKMADGGDVSEMKIGKTTIRKGYNGWVGKTMVDNFKGYDWDITTIKNSRGDLTTTAQGGKSEDKGGYKMFTFMMFQDPSIRLQTSRPPRVNEKAVSEQHAEALKVFKEKVGNTTTDKEKMADGGAIGFDALAKKVAKNYEGDKVKKEFQNEYGKTYDKKEAEEVGKKVAGKVYGQQQAKKKMAKGGKVAKKSGTPANRSQSKMTLISRKASEIRKANEPWRDAFNRAKSMLYS